MPLTLSLYFGRVFMLAVAGMLAGLTAIVALFDFLELLRESAARPQVSFGIVLQIEILRLPWSVLQLLPFAVLLGGLYAFWKLGRASELVVARAAGISAWQFLAGPVLLAACLGGLGTGALSPISATMFGRAELLDDAYLKPGGGPLSLNGGELWVRQADKALTPGGVAVLHASNVHLNGTVLTTDSITILRLDGGNALLARIEAGHATLSTGSWELDDVNTLTPGNAPEHAGTLAFPTDLTVNRVQRSFASPDSLSFWELPGFIRLLKRSGFSATQHELAFQALFALPLLCATMALLAAGFSMSQNRRGGTGKMVTLGASAGFSLFMISEIANQLGNSGAVPVVLAAWAPALAGLFLALALLLHLEDG
jgi:lipopolysaccharide export system permease protein